MYSEVEFIQPALGNLVIAQELIFPNLVILGILCSGAECWSRDSDTYEYTVGLSVVLVKMTLLPVRGHNLSSCQYLNLFYDVSGRSSEEVFTGRIQRKENTQGEQDVDVIIDHICGLCIRGGSSKLLMSKILDFLGFLKTKRKIIRFSPERKLFPTNGSKSLFIGCLC